MFSLRFLGAGNFTVFAPNNKAFSKVPAKVAADIDLLTSILLYHVSASPTLYSVGLEDSQQIPTLNTKNSLTINLKDGKRILDKLNSSIVLKLKAGCISSP